MSAVEIRKSLRVRDFIGVSTDSKPTTDCDAGSTFYETDTKAIYIFDGTQWCAV